MLSNSDLNLYNLFPDPKYRCPGYRNGVEETTIYK